MQPEKVGHAENFDHTIVGIFDGSGLGYNDGLGLVEERVRVFWAVIGGIGGLWGWVRLEGKFRFRII